MFTRGYTVNDGSMAKLIRLLYHPITIPSSRLCCRLQPCNDLMSWPRAKCLLYNSVSYIIYQNTRVYIYIYVCLYIYEYVHPFYTLLIINMLPRLAPSHSPVAPAAQDPAAAAAAR